MFQHENSCAPMQFTLELVSEVRETIDARFLVVV